MERITLGERAALAEIFAREHKDIPITPPKGQPMPQTVEYWEHLAELYGNTIKRQDAKIERLMLKNNQLRQKIKQGIL